jgi:phage-related protein
MGRSIIFYKTSDGKCPIEDFFDSLPGKVAQKITWVLRLIEDLEIVPVTYFKKLTGSEEIWECQIQQGSNVYRIFSFFDEGAVVVLTHGIEKKSMKTPKREIERAELFRKDFLRRRKNE